jgi:hypothetical protein
LENNGGKWVLMPVDMTMAIGVVLVGVIVMAGTAWLALRK